MNVTTSNVSSIPLNTTITANVTNSGSLYLNSNLLNANMTGYSGIYDSVLSTTDSTLNVKGDIVIDGGGDIVCNGKSLGARLDAIESRLGILNFNTDLEYRWIELRELGKKYRDLEKELLNSEKLWDILRGT